MSDQQNNTIQHGKNPKVKGGWHQPEEVTLWRTPEGDEEPQPVGWTMPALPQELDNTPQQQGGWHLPSPEDTPFSEGDAIQKGQPVVIVTEPEPVQTAQEDRAPSPEDMIAQILGQQPKKAAVGAPEDIVKNYVKKEQAAPLKPGIDDEDVDEAVEDLLDNLDALDEEEDVDDDAFAMSERTALLSLDEDEIGEEIPEDEQRALIEAVMRATDEFAPPTQQQIDSVQTPTPPSSDLSTEQAKEYARKMLEQFGTEDDEDEGAGTLSGLFGGTAAIDDKLNTNQAADYAEQMLRQLGSDDTGASDTMSTQPLPGYASRQAAYISPQTRANAQKFRDVQRQVATLNRLYQDEAMSYDDYQRQLYENMVQDENGVWWMIGANSDKWYRHNTTSNEWEEGYPPSLMELEQYERAMQGDSSPVSAPQTYDLPSIDGEFSIGTAPQQVGDTIRDQYGVPVGYVQPQMDDQYTQVGSSAFANEIAGQQPTILNPSSNYDNTMQSPSTLEPTVPMAAIAQGYDNIDSPRDSSAPGDYGFEQAPTIKEIRDEERRSTARVLAFALLAVVALGLVVVITGFIGIALWYSNTVEPYKAGIAALAEYDPPFQTARIFDANGELIVELNSQDTGARTAIPLEDMSPYIIHAIISQENERFYQDPGFDPIAVVRAFIQNVTGGEISSGASTITQQIAKNLVLQDTEVTAERKISEILVAMEIANTYDKNFILELYLNEIFFGNQSYGVEAASQFYFNHGADEITYPEAALLASIVPSPALNDPVVNRPTAMTRMKETMRKMIQVGCLQFQHGDWETRGPFCIGPDVFVNFEGSNVRLLTLDGQGNINGGLAALQIAQVETGQYESRNVRTKYPHFVNYVQSEIEAQFGANALFQRGFNIYTTLVPAVQDTAENALSRRVDELVDNGVNTGSVMVTDPTNGAIRAMVGSHDFTDENAGQVNNALTWQQPGSSIKAVVYTAALIGNGDQYLTPATILWDVPVTYNIGGTNYQPVNFDRRFHGPTPLRFALQNSYNVSAVKAYAQIGNQKFLETAQAMGLNFPENTSFNLPSALGANEVRLIDMMEAFGTLANGGVRVPLYAIERITETVDGSQIEVPLPEREGSVQAISPQVAYLMTNILSDDNARAEQFGRNGNLTLTRIGVANGLNRVAAKTGTSNDGRDLWTMGYTRNVVVGVWIGTYDNSPTFNTTGFLAASPVWNLTMEAALRGRQIPEFQNPGGVITQEICRTTGTLYYEGCPERTTGLFIQGKFPPPAEQGFVQAIAIDSWTGLRANEFCPDNVTQSTFANLADTSAINWLNTTNEGRAFAQLVGLPIPLVQAPTDACQQGQGLPTINLTYPGANAILQDVVNITGQVQAPNNFVRYELEYSTATQPNTWVPIGPSQSQQQPVGGSTLGTWDTKLVPNGNYTVRLAVHSNTGGTIYRTAPVSVNNILPTPTPTAIPLPTIDPNTGSSTFNSDNAIPFDTLNPTSTPQGG